MHEENVVTGTPLCFMHLHKFYREKFDFKENYFQNAKIRFELYNLVALAAKALFDEDIEDIIGAVQRAVGYHKE